MVPPPQLTLPPLTPLHVPELADTRLSARAVDAISADLRGNRCDESLVGIRRDVALTTEVLARAK